MKYDIRRIRHSRESGNLILAFARMTLILLCLSTFSVAAEETHPVIILNVSGTIDPALARYVTRGLEEARDLQASAVVIQLDTPGGLDGSMRKIVQAVLNSPVPVIVYVAPSGARAASAGAFITLAAHVAAMAPGTNIGAAHPVQLAGGNALAYIQSITEIRGRNGTWARRFVQENRSSTAEEAKEDGVIDVVANDLDDLLNQIDGQQVGTVFGATTLAMKEQPRRPLPKSFMEAALHQLAHPNVAYILLLLGIYGLIFELSIPGVTLPGVLGAMLLVLALVAMETMEVNWAGIALILLSLIFFVADIKLPGYGALTIGGILSFLIGSGLLFPGTRSPHLRLPWELIAAATGITAAFFIFIVGVGIRALKRKVTTGIEGLIGSEGVAKTDLKPHGLVHVKGEEWQARAEFPIKKDAKVRVVKLEGLTVHVEFVKEVSA